jgi:hypothetical protein
MPTFGQDFLKGFIGNNSLRDYQHASRTFTTNAYELKPRYKFLFHVSFTLNVQEIPFLRGALGNDEINMLSLAVKTIDLPKYNIDTETLNQYNRKRIIQKRINYEPVTVTLHDTSGDLVRKMWYYYMSYYYKDPAQQYLDANNNNGENGASANRQAGFGYNSRDIYSKQRIGNVNDWGYIGEAYNDGGSSAVSGKPPFFRDIRIYGMDQHKFAEYVLINPLITNWSHDQYSYAEGGGTMQDSMTIAYETVKYYAGAVGDSKRGGDQNIKGFADVAHYDTTTSPLSRPGSTATVFGQGGLLDAGAGILGDLQSGSVLGLIGAAQKAARVNQSFKGKNLAAITKSEATSLGKNVVIGALPGATRAVANKADGWIFPQQQAARQAQTAGRNNPNPGA